MINDFILRISSEALLLTLVISGPPVIFSLLVGLTVSLFQAVTQVQEQSLTFVPKTIIVMGTLAALGPWLGSTMVEFTRLCFEGFATAVGQ